MDFVERTMIPTRTIVESEATETVDRLLRAASLLRLKLGEFLDQFDLTEVRHSVLTALNGASELGLSQSELAERLMQSESNVSTLIERMTQDGLVERLRSHADRRKRVLLLTTEGQRLVERVEATKASWAIRQLQGVPADDRATLGLLLGQVIAGQEGRPAVKAHAATFGATANGDSMDSLEENSVTIESGWVEDRHEGEGDIRSPHRALEQMLSALGLVNQLVKEES